MSLPACLDRAGLSAETLEQIGYRLVGCGGFIRELIEFTSGASTVKDDSGQRLSVADCLVDAILRTELPELVPASSGYSEEGGAFGQSTEGVHVRWLLDPLDGTRVATLGGAYAVSLSGLVLDGEQPLAAVGWVYVPTLHILYRGIIAPGFAECLRNNTPIRAELDLSKLDLSRRYIAVGSDWNLRPISPCPMKISAPGATAVHLTQLVHTVSDVAAVSLTRYRPYDASAGLVIAVAGGCEIYRIEEPTRRIGKPLELLPFLAELDRQPDTFGPAALVCLPQVADSLRHTQ